MYEFTRNIAVVIGINDYQNGIAKLQSAVNDARRLAEILQQQPKPHNYEIVIVEEQPTLANLKILLEHTLPKVIKPTEEDRLLFYFAGHGTAINSQDGPAGYLIPRDAQPNQPTTFLAMEDLHVALCKLACRHLLVILDCCFAGSFRWASARDLLSVPETIYKERYDHYIQHRAWQVITSAAHNQKALDILLDNRGTSSSDFNSPFAQTLIEALKDGKADYTKDGITTVTELYLYIRERLKQELSNQSQPQIPGLWPLQQHDRGEFFFLAENFDRNNLPEAPPLDPKNNPYRGLKPFEKTHSNIFFGRKELVDKLYAHISRDVRGDRENGKIFTPLTVVLGVSGSGKSSLVKAGLIPFIEEKNKEREIKQETAEWHVLDVMRPGKHPFTSLARIILPIANVKANTTNSIQTLSQALQEDPETMREIIAFWTKNNIGKKLLLVIDQFEELVTMSSNSKEDKRPNSKPEWQQFICLLVDAIKAYAQELRIVVTLRSDFEPQFLDLALEPYWTEGRFLVTAMRADELRQAIEKPAEQKALFFEPPTLVDELIAEVIQMPGALPLLSFTLRELYTQLSERFKRGDISRAITEEDYKKIGGVAGSLSRRATEEYDALDKPHQATMQRVMLRMVTIESGGTRRQVPLSELVYPDPDNTISWQVKDIRERLVKVRLIVQGKDTTESYIEPAHDFLVRGWNKLQQWIKEEKENITLRQRLTPAANDWFNQKDEEQKIGLLWADDPRLPLLEEVRKSKNNWLNRRETEFVQNSVTQKQNELQQTEKQRDEALQGQITALAALSEARFQDDQLGALIHILKAGRILQQIIKSESQWIKEDTRLRTEVVLRQILSKVKEFNRLEDKDIQFNRMRTLAFTTSNKLVIIEQRRLLTLNSIFPQQELILIESQHITNRPVISFWQLNGGLENRGLLESPLDTWNPVSQMLAHFIHRASPPQQEPKANAIRLVNLEGKQVILQNDERDTLMTFAFSPNGQLIASGGWFGELYLWKIDGTTIKQIQTAGNSLNAIDFSPNGDMLATGSNDGKIRFWDQNGEFLKEIEAHRDAIWGVSFSPDGETLASVSTDTTVKIWKTNGTLLITLNGHRDKVGAVCFNSDGQILASASDKGIVRLWKPNGTKLKNLDDHHTGEVYAVRFNPKQSMIATTSGQGQLILWSQDGRLLRTWGKGHNGTITALDFSPNGRMFVTAAGDREVKLWRLDDIDKQDFRSHTLGNHTGEIHLPTVFGVSFSSDNQTILLGNGSHDGKGFVELCDSESMSCRIIAEYECQVLAVCFSPDGQMFALGKGDGSVELWRKEEDDFKLLRNFNQHNNVVLVVCFSPDGKFLATGSADKTVKLWQIEQILNNGSIPTVTPTNILAHTDRVTAVRFSPNGDLIATASYDKTVKLWNLDGTWKKTLHGHNDRVNALDFSPDGRTLASASNDKTVILWNLELELGLDNLIDCGCDWISGYLTNNPNVSEEDRELLKEFPPLPYESQKWMS